MFTEALAARIIATLQEPFILDGRQAQIGVSVGLAFVPEHGQDPAVLLAATDVALYRAQEARGSSRSTGQAWSSRGHPQHRRKSTTSPHTGTRP